MTAYPINSGVVGDAPDMAFYPDKQKMAGLGGRPDNHLEMLSHLAFSILPCPNSGHDTWSARGIEVSP